MCNCKECKFWNKQGQPWHDDIYARCEIIKEANVVKEEQAIAYVSDCMDGGGYHYFHTRGDFGCILGEKTHN